MRSPTILTIFFFTIMIIMVNSQSDNLDILLDSIDVLPSDAFDSTEGTDGYSAFVFTEQTPAVAIGNTKIEQRTISTPLILNSIFKMADAKTTCLFSVTDKAGSIKLGLCFTPAGVDIYRITLESDSFTSKVSFIVNEISNIEWTRLTVWVESNKVSLYINCSMIDSVDVERVRDIELAKDSKLHLAHYGAVSKNFFTGPIQEIKLYTNAEDMTVQDICTEIPALPDSFRGDTDQSEPREPTKVVEKGEKGDKGEAGNTVVGPPGPAGPPGISTIDGKCECSEEKISKLLQTMPQMRGEKGDRGERGECGPGDKGERGEPGMPGIKGNTGEKGAVGQKGDPGYPGMNGLPGLRGPTGPPASVESQKPQKGEKGERGESGKNGADGKPGAKGENGLSVDLSALIETIRTNESVKAMLRGEKGTIGEKGPKGEPGKNGSRGLPGTKGTAGVRGKPGPRGPRGMAGEKGDKGECVNTKQYETVGVQGPPGPPGPPGLSIVGPKGEPGAVISEKAYFYETDTKADEDEFYAANTIVIKSVESLKRRTSSTPLGTFAYVLREKNLLLRVENGWRYIAMGPMLASDQEVREDILTETAEPSTENSQHRSYIRMAALEKPYSGSMRSTSGRTGRSSANHACYRQSQRSGLEGTFVAFLASNVEDLRWLVKTKRDRRLPVVNLRGEILFSSWNEMFNGSGASLLRTSGIYSFSGKNVLEDDNWPVKVVWHGGDAHGVRSTQAFCSEWQSESHQQFGTASSLVSGKLLNQEMFPCDREFIVLCVEATANVPTARRRRHKLSKRFNKAL